MKSAVFQVGLCGGTAGAAACATLSAPYGSLVGRMCGIDPSAGSPTETLLRLLLPLNDKV